MDSKHGGGFVSALGLATLLMTQTPAFSDQPKPRSAEAGDMAASARTAAYWVDQGNGFYLAGHPAEAAAAYRQAVALEPGKADLHYHLGVALASGGHLSLAETSLRKALALDPSSAAAQVSLAGLLARSGRSEEAERHLKQARLLAPTDPSVHHALGMLHLAQGHHDAAVEDFKRALALNPRNPPAELGLGRAQVASGRHAAGEQAIVEARADLDSAAEKDFDTTVDSWSYPRKAAGGRVGRVETAMGAPGIGR